MLHQLRRASANLPENTALVISIALTIVGSLVVLLLGKSLLPFIVDHWQVVVPLIGALAGLASYFLVRSELTK